jgi:hypothetical protein
LGVGGRGKTDGETLGKGKGKRSKERRKVKG